MDPSPLLATLLGFGAILIGNVLEGGHLSSLLSGISLLIVVGGSVGATWLGSTNEELKNLVKFTPRLVRPVMADRNKLATDMLKASNVARREGMLAVEGILPQIEDAYLRKGLQMLVDGHSAEDVRKILELEAEIEEHHHVAVAKLWETVGRLLPHHRHRRRRAGADPRDEQPG